MLHVSRTHSLEVLEYNPEAICVSQGILVLDITSVELVDKFWILEAPGRTKNCLLETQDPGDWL